MDHNDRNLIQISPPIPALARMCNLDMDKPLYLVKRGRVPIVH